MENCNQKYLINFLAGISRVAPPSKISPTADNSYISHQCILLGLHQVDCDDAGDDVTVHSVTVHQVNCDDHLVHCDTEKERNYDDDESMVNAMRVMKIMIRPEKFVAPRVRP